MSACLQHPWWQAPACSLHPFPYLSASARPDAWTCCHVQATGGTTGVPAPAALAAAEGITAVEASQQDAGRATALPAPTSAATATAASAAARMERPIDQTITPVADATTTTTTVASAVQILASSASSAVHGSGPMGASAAAGATTDITASDRSPRAAVKLPLGQQQERRPAGDDNKKPRRPWLACFACGTSSM
jgi:hypothetical protein